MTVMAALSSNNGCSGSCGAREEVECVGAASMWGSKLDCAIPTGQRGEVSGGQRLIFCHHESNPPRCDAVVIVLPKRMSPRQLMGATGLLSAADFQLTAVVVLMGVEGSMPGMLPMVVVAAQSPPG